MEKKEAKKIIKEVLKKYGFHPNKIGGYKILDNDYLIGMNMTHSTYCKGYMMDYGVIYLPDEEKMPFDGIYDWRGAFLFTKTEGDDLRKYKDILLSGYGDESLWHVFEYGVRTSEEFKEQLAINIEVKMSRLYDKNFVLDYYRTHMDKLYLIVDTDLGIAKLAKLVGHDLRELLARRRAWEAGDFETLYDLKEQAGDLDNVEGWMALKVIRDRRKAERESMQ